MLSANTKCEPFQTQIHKRHYTKNNIGWKTENVESTHMTNQLPHTLEPHNLTDCLAGEWDLVEPRVVELLRCNCCSLFDVDGGSCCLFDSSSVLMRCWLCERKKTIVDINSGTVTLLQT